MPGRRIGGEQPVEGVPMPGVDKATGRTVAVIVLAVLAVVALRGYLPGAQPEPTSDEQPDGDPATLVPVVATLVLSMVIIAIAIITQMRAPTVAANTVAELPREWGGTRRRITWRFWLIVLGAVIGWFLFMLLLMQLGVVLPDVDEPPPSGNESSTETPGDGTVPPPPEPPPPDTGGDVLGYLAAAAVLLVILSMVGSVVASRRRRRGAFPEIVSGDGGEPPVTADGSQSLVRAAELGLAEIGDLSREPREAIIACYATMERQLENAPGAVPQDSDTPSEVLARAVENHALRADSATGLVDLFEEARFSPHVMNEGHREVAVATLRLVLAELRGTA